jgi:predicted MPP superfamily phosphohydrolase
MNKFKELSLQVRKQKEANVRGTKNSLLRTMFNGVCALPLWEVMFRKSCEQLKINDQKFYFSNLPIEFDGYKILFVSDLHLEVMPSPLETFMKMDLPDHDIVVIGGDFFDKNDFRKDELLEKFLGKFSKPIYAVFGNHDRLAIMDILEKFKVNVLFNESVILTKGDDQILLTGIDDVTNFKSEYQLECAKEASDSFSGFKIVASHNPDFLINAEELNYNLQLSGHTHGGQFKLLNYIVFPQTEHEFAVADKWQYKSLKGFTTTGFGSSGYPIRNIIPELVIIELNRK